MASTSPADSTTDAGGPAVPSDVLALVADREAARRAGDFARADALRDELTARGWLGTDTPAGSEVRRA